MIIFSQCFAIERRQFLFSSLIHILRERRARAVLLRPRVVIGNSNASSRINQGQQGNRSVDPVPLQECQMVFAQSAHAQPHRRKSLEKMHSLLGISADTIRQPQPDSALQSEMDSVVNIIELRHGRIRAGVVLAVVVRVHRSGQGVDKPLQAPQFLYVSSRPIYRLRHFFQGIASGQAGPQACVKEFETDEPRHQAEHRSGTSVEFHGGVLAKRSGDDPNAIPTPVKHVVQYRSPPDSRPRLRRTSVVRAEDENLIGPPS